MYYIYHIYIYVYLQICRYGILFFCQTEIALLWVFSDVRGYTVSESGWKPLGGQEELLGEKGGGTLTFLCVPFVSFTFSTMSVCYLFKK